MWYAKMYFSGEKEFFENDAFGMQGVPSRQLELPFLESLLTFLELDEKEITPMLERISVNWERFVESRAREAYTAAMVELGVLAEKHIYLRLLYTRCYSCSFRRDLGKAPLQAISLDLKEFAKQFSETRKRVATVYKGNIIKNLIMDCQSYTKYRPNETTGGIFVSWRRKEELPTGA